LILCANDKNLPLDLYVIIHNSLDKKNEPLKLEQKDVGHQMFVHIYPEEFFKSNKDARKFFDNIIVPNLDNFGMYYTNYAT